MSSLEWENSTLDILDIVQEMLRTEKKVAVQDVIAKVHEKLGLEVISEKDFKKKFCTGPMSSRVFFFWSNKNENWITFAKDVNAEWNPEERPDIKMLDELAEQIHEERNIQKSSITGSKPVKAIFETMMQDSTEPLIDRVLTEEAKSEILRLRRKQDDADEWLKKKQDEYVGLEEMVKGTAATVRLIAEAQQENGTVSSERAKDTLALYGAILAMNQKIGCTPSENVTTTGYVMYAYLGGQAKRDYSSVGSFRKNRPVTEDDCEDEAYF